MLKNMLNIYHININQYICVCVCADLPKSNKKSGDFQLSEISYKKLFSIILMDIKMFFSATTAADKLDQVCFIFNKYIYGKISHCINI